MFVLFFSSNLFSQNIDSLLNVLKTTEQKQKVLVEIISYYENISPQKTIDFCDTLLLLANKSENTQNQAFALEKLGKGNFYLGNYVLAYDSWKKSLEKYIQIDDKAGIGKLYNNIGAYYYSIGDYENSLQNYLQSLKIRKELNDNIGIAKNLNNIGNIYYAQNQRDLSFETYLEALEYAKLSSDKKILSIVLNNIGAEYAFQQEYQKALDFHFQAVELKKELKSEISLAVTFMSIGSIYKPLEEYEKAREYYDLAFSIFKSKKSKYYQAKVLNQIAGLYKAQNNYDSTLFYLKSSLEISQNINSLVMLEANYLGLSAIYDSLRNFKKSSEYLKLYLSIHDSLFNSQSDRRIKDLQIKYETDKKEQENLILTKQIEIETLKGDRRQNMMFFFIAISLFLMILAIVIYSMFSVKQKLSKLLTEKNTKLLESETNLKEAVATKDKFFSIIAHDLRSPLSSLTLVSEMLNENSESFSSEKMKRYINSITQTSSGLFDLVENLLSWARSQSGKIGFNAQKVSAYEIVDKLVSLLTINANKKNIVIENLILKDIYIKADINLLTLILRNLLVNAVKFTNEGGKIIVASQNIENNIVISVQDNGIGMSKEDQEKLFRIDIDTKDIGNSAEKGTGLGLILCKEFIEKQNGKIWLESELGEGTTFFISLPLA